jgi:adenylate kinase family enzyme
MVDPKTNIVYNLKTKKPENKEILNRLTKRISDTEEIFINRLKRYHKTNEILFEYYKEKIYNIDGNKSENEIFGNIKKIINF